VVFADRFGIGLGLASAYYRFAFGAVNSPFASGYGIIENYFAGVFAQCVLNSRFAASRQFLQV